MLAVCEQLFRSLSPPLMDDIWLAESRTTVLRDDTSIMWVKQWRSKLTGEPKKWAIGWLHQPQNDTRNWGNDVKMQQKSTRVQSFGGGHKSSVSVITRQSLQTRFFIIIIIIIRVQTSIQYIRKPTCEERLHGILLQKGYYSRLIFIHR